MDIASFHHTFAGFVLIHSAVYIFIHSSRLHALSHSFLFVLLGGPCQGQAKLNKQAWAILHFCWSKRKETIFLSDIVQYCPLKNMKSLLRFDLITASLKTAFDWYGTKWTDTFLTSNENLSLILNLWSKIWLILFCIPQNISLSIMNNTLYVGIVQLHLSMAPFHFVNYSSQVKDKSQAHSFYQALHSFKSNCL